MKATAENTASNSGKSVEQVARAILYEGYLLYPYRPSAVKNVQRWTFGGVYPPAYSAGQTGSDGWLMQTECLLAGSAESHLTFQVRFLHLVERLLGELTLPLPSWPDPPSEPDFRLVAALRVGERNYLAWQEAMEQSIDGELAIADALAGPCIIPFAFSARRQLEPLADSTSMSQSIVGVLVRQQECIDGEIEVLASAVAEGLFRFTLRIRNATRVDEATAGDRNRALHHTLISTHTILQVRDGEFVSLLDPPESCKDHAEKCQNIGTYPVLAGEQGSRATLLSSPIILYDHPQVASESPGDLFDATEIDEILTLRILTLTEEEKQEMASADERARRLLERTENLAREQMMSLHGSMRGVESGSREEIPTWTPWQQERPAGEYARADGVTFRPGAQVQLAPSGRGDIFDLALVGKTGVLETIEQDLDGQFFFTVSVDDDPGQDLGARGIPGHRFFFRPDEVSLRGSEENPSPQPPPRSGEGEQEFFRLPFPSRVGSSLWLPLSASGRGLGGGVLSLPLCPGEAKKEKAEVRQKSPSMLIAGIGNIFFGDDAFGVEVIRRLGQCSWPESVKVVDFGIRGFDLACALVDGHDVALLVDATSQGGEPGTLYVIEPEGSSELSPEQVEGHSLHPARVLALARSLGNVCPWVRIIGCEPLTFGSEDEPAEKLSEPVERAVSEVVAMIEEMVRKFLDVGQQNGENK